MNNFSFTNMNPSDRLKASGLIGLIVILVFFVIYTVLGAVSPKKPAAALAAAAAQLGVPSQTAPAPADPAPTAAAAVFPTEKAMSKGRGLANSLSMDIPDPFVPIAHPKEGMSAPAGAATKNSGEPKVEVQPLPPLDNPMQPVADVRLAGAGSLPGLPAGPSAGSSPGVLGIAPPPAEPEIRLVGIVQGDDSIATLKVAGHIVLARPGDVLAKGYRLMAISPEGVVIRHQGESVPLRVGSILNQAKSDANEPGSDSRP